jgi:hypothetical protein
LKTSYVDPAVLTSKEQFDDYRFASFLESAIRFHEC